MSRKTEHCLSHRLNHFSPCQIAQRIVRRNEMLSSIRFFIFGCNRYKQAVTLEASQHVVARYAVEISRDSAARGIKTMPLAHQHNEDLLSNILCRSFRPAH